MGVIAGHPLDTVIVRMQFETRRTTPVLIITETFKKEGLKGFYKGMLQPLIGVLPYGITIFTANELIKKQI